MYDQITEWCKTLSDYDYEIILINDGSPDNTWWVIEKICQTDTYVKGVNLSRNFGHQAALTAWLSVCRGDLIISMDCDGQDPISVALEMVQLQEKHNHDIVYARRKKRNDNFFKKHTALWYYKILSGISNTQIPRNVGDFRLVTRQVLDRFLALPEHDRYIRWMVARLGFDVWYVDFDRPEREHGETGYTRSKMIKLATDGVLNFSMAPLKLGLFLGIIMILMSIGFFGYVTVDFFINDVPYPLYKRLTIAMFGFMGLLFIFMWIVGEYIGRIYNEVRQRPIYIIKEILNETKS